jgi:ribosome modulation factor
MSASNIDMKNSYNNGFIARNDDQSQAACPHGISAFNLRCQWLAGWNDRDLELKL